VTLIYKLTMICSYTDTRFLPWNWMILYYNVYFICIFFLFCVKIYLRLKMVALKWNVFKWSMRLIVVRSNDSVIWRASKLPRQSDQTQIIYHYIREKFNEEMFSPWTTCQATGAVSWHIHQANTTNKIKGTQGDVGYLYI